MGQTTPNIGIYIPVTFETGYDQAFEAGMINVDQHDHSGGPNKGLPITSAGLSPFSVTFDKLKKEINLEVIAQCIWTRSCSCNIIIHLPDIVCNA